MMIWTTTHRFPNIPKQTTKVSISLVILNFYSYVGDLEFGAQNFNPCNFLSIRSFVVVAAKKTSTKTMTGGQNERHGETANKLRDNHQNSPQQNNNQIKQQNQQQNLDVSAVISLIDSSDDEGIYASKQTFP